MNEEPDIDGSMPDEGNDEERQTQRESEPVVRRNAPSPPVPRASPDSEPMFDNFSTAGEPGALREKLSLIAGAGFTMLLAYFWFFIGIDETSTLNLAVSVTFLVAVSLWFYMRGAQKMDPVRANFFAGVIGILALIVLWQGWDTAKSHLVVSALLSALSTFCFLKASELE